MTDFLIRPYVCAIIAISVILFLAVDELEPNRRLAIILQFATLRRRRDCQSVDFLAALAAIKVLTRWKPGTLSASSP